MAFIFAHAGNEAARRAGMKAVAITSGDTAQRLQGAHVLAALPDYRGVDPQDILKLAADNAVAAD